VTWPPEGSGQRGRCEVRLKKVVEWMMEQRNLKSDDPLNGIIWRLKTDNRWNNGKVSDKQIQRDREKVS
jgi:hypothetical protein